MILFLEEGFDGSSPAPGLSRDVRDLLTRRGSDGAAKRGPLVTIGSGTENGQPLAALADGEKLHVVARGSAHDVAGRSPRELVHLLASLGLAREVELKQIHLFVDHTGNGYAEALAEALAAEGFRVREIKAPRGAVAWDENGKAHVHTAGGWQPSGKMLNAYAGPAVQPKHRH